MVRRHMPIAVLLAGVVVLGCETVVGNAAPVTSRPLVDSHHAVYIHTLGWAPKAMPMVGVVTARGVGEDATVDHVVAELVRQAQTLGAQHLLIDNLHMEYFWYPATSTMMNECEMRWCSSATWTGREVPAMVAQGRAYGFATLVVGGAKP